MRLYSSKIVSGYTAYALVTKLVSWIKKLTASIDIVKGVER